MSTVESDSTLAELITAFNNLANKFAEQHPNEACPPEECVALDSIEEGQYLVATSAATDCASALSPSSGNGLAVVNGSTVEIHDGSSSDPIILDDLYSIQGDFNGLLALQDDGTFRHWTPLPHDARHKLTTLGGTISQTIDKTENEFLFDDISESCPKDAQFVIGGVSTVNSAGQTVIKLIKVPQSEFVNFVCTNCGVESYDQVWNII